MRFAPHGRAAYLARTATPATSLTMTMTTAPTWRDPDGKPVSCLEKIKVLNDNFAELRRMAQDALEDAILMGCDETQFRAVLHEVVDSLKNPYRKP
jgi:hypothetical protein